MLKKILDGFYLGVGLFIFFGILFGIVWAVGFHSADEILSGKFQGNFVFNGTMNFSSATVVGFSGSGILKDSNIDCDFSSEGQIKYNSTSKTFEGCNGNSWNIIKSMPIILGSCLDILNAGQSIGNGIYSIDPDGDGGNAPFNVYCDMTTSGGGWTRIKDRTEKYSSVSSNLMTFTRTLSTDVYGIQGDSSQLTFSDCFGANSVTGYVIGVSNAHSTYTNLLITPKIDYSQVRMAAHWWYVTGSADIGGYDISSPSGCGDTRCWTPNEIIDTGFSKGKHVISFVHNTGSGGSQDGLIELWVR